MSSQPQSLCSSLLCQDHLISWVSLISRSKQLLYECRRMSVTVLAQAAIVQELPPCSQAGSAMGKTCEELRAALRKTGRKVTGNKLELRNRLQEVLVTNDRGWARRGKASCSRIRYLASGAHRDVYLEEYSKGPRKGQFCVSKHFKTGSVYEDRFFSEDISANKEAAEIINHKCNHVCQKGGWGLPPGRKVHFKAVAGTTFAQGLSLPARPPDPPAPPPAQSEMMLLLLAAIVLARARA